jgi:hypothetical protein
MKKVVRLTERDLTRIVKKILNEDANVDGTSISVDGTDTVTIGNSKYKVTVESAVYSGPVNVKQFTGPHNGWTGNYFTIVTGKDQTKDFSVDDIKNLVSQSKQGGRQITISGFLGDAIFTKV